MKPKIINTADGSQTLYIAEMDEQYHSTNGAITESNYVYIDKGYIFNKSNNPTIFEVGFGTGLNCLLTALLAEKQKRHTIYYTIEKYPLDKEIIQQLKYGKNISAEGAVLFENIHDCEWGKPVQISQYFSLIKLKSDLQKNDLKEIKNCDVIYFDAFGPDKQPEMWQPQIFQKIYSITAKNGVFVTYSAKGEVRRQLAKCGFQMERLPGPPKKREILRGIKPA
jgi:tRNA U34 5-methylaminomethyl-2-thiouridine-forming methyltransferase MnmC